MSAAARREEFVPSPCIGLCELDGESGLCKGCLRTGGEIAAWGSGSTAVRHEILERVSARNNDPEIQKRIEVWERSAR